MEEPSIVAPSHEVQESLQAYHKQRTEGGAYVGLNIPLRVNGKPCTSRFAVPFGDVVILVAVDDPADPNGAFATTLVVMPDESDARYSFVPKKIIPLSQSQLLKVAWSGDELLALLARTSWQ